MGGGVAMIELWTGTPGSGKSATVVSIAIEFMRMGGCVLSNFSLVPGWADVVAAHDLIGRFSRSYRARLARVLARRWHVFDDVESVWAFAPTINDYCAPVVRRRYEGRCLLIIDEAQLIFNSRDWQKNFKWVEFFSQHRKLGFDVILIAHSESMLDSQCRNFIEYVVRLRNLKRIKIPFLQIPFSWLFFCDNLFACRWHYYGSGPLGGESFKIRFIPLHKWMASLYDSLACFRVGDFSISSKTAPPVVDPAGAASAQSVLIPPERLLPLLQGISSAVLLARLSHQDGGRVQTAVRLCAGVRRPGDGVRQYFLQ